MCQKESKSRGGKLKNYLECKSMKHMMQRIVFKVAFLFVYVISDVCYLGTARQLENKHICTPPSQSIPSRVRNATFIDRLQCRIRKYLSSIVIGLSGLLVIHNTKSFRAFRVLRLTLTCKKVTSRCVAFRC